MICHSKTSGRPAHMGVISHMNLLVGLTGKAGLIAILLSLTVNNVYAQLRSYTYKCEWTDTPVRIDGILNDSAWNRTGFISFTDNSDNSPAPFKTEAAILYNDSFIYFGFKCIDENIWASMMNRDEHLWEEEVVEVFLQTDTTQPGYAEVEVNPLGTVLDGFMADSVHQLPYESFNISNLQCAVHVSGSIDENAGDSVWNCELAIPFREILFAEKKVKAGDTWYFNLFRAELKPKYLLLSWSPTYHNDFHMPSYFGRLIFNRQENQ